MVTSTDTLTFKGSAQSASTAETRSAHRYALTLSREEAARFVAMGPSAWHVGPERVSTVLADWAEPVTVSVSVEVTTYGRRAQR